MRAPDIDFGRDRPAPHPDEILVVADVYEAIRIGHRMASAYRSAYLEALALTHHYQRQLRREHEARVRLLDELRTLRTREREAPRRVSA